MKKVCKCCGRNRKIGKFGRLSASSDGKNPYCRECMREITKRYKTSSIGILKQEKAVKKWKKKNKKHIKEYNKDYYLKNKSRILYNKKCREDTECMLITEIPEKTKQRKINKSRKVYIIEINPKRK
jgi:hypothetical protein